MKYASLFLIIVTMLAGLVLSACGPTATEAPSEASLPAPTGAAGELIVVDAMGRTVEFAQPPQRIVIAGRATIMMTNAMYLFPEARERVIAMTSGMQKPGRFLAFVDPTFSEKRLLEPDAGPEQIAPLDPDVVVLRSFMADKLGNALEKLDIPVIYVDLETPEQYFRDLGTFGQLFGNEARVEEIRAFYQARLDAIADKMQDLSAEQKPSVLLLQRSDKGGDVAFNVPPASWIQTIEVELAGGSPLWKDTAQGNGWTVVNFEQVASWDADRIFVISYSADAAEIVDGLKADPQWQALKAVQDEEIYGFAADIYSWDQSDPRWILGVTWLAGKIHPDRFPDLDMPQQVIQFFEQMYGMDKSVIQEHIISTLKGNIE